MACITPLRVRRYKAYLKRITLLLAEAAMVMSMLVVIMSGPARAENLVIHEDNDNHFGDVRL